MKLKYSTRTRLSFKSIFLTATSFCFVLALGIIISINVTDNREARAASSGDYRTRVSGDWSNISTWEKYNGTVWMPAMSAPTSADGVIEIQNGHFVTITTSIAADEIVVDEAAVLTNATGTFTINDGSGTDFILKGLWNVSGAVKFSEGSSGEITGMTFCDNSGNVTIESGSSIIIKNLGLFEKDGGNVTTTSGAWIVEDGGSYRHNHNGGTLPSATWSVNSNCEITGVTTAAPSNFNQSFGNVSWSSASQIANVNLTKTLISVAGDFRMTSTGTGSLKFCSEGNNSTIAVSGNYYHDGGKVILTESGTMIFNVTGNFNITEGELLFTDGTSPSTGDGLPIVTISGNLLMSGGTIDISQSTSTVAGTGIGTLNLKGNVSITGGNVKATSAGSGYGCIVFNKAGSQNYTGQIPFGNKIDFIVKTGATLNLAQNIISGGRNFTVNSGGALMIGDKNGISVTEATGNIQTSGNRNFSPAATYIYNGTLAQVTGNGLPVSVSNLTINNASGLSLTKSVTIYNTLTLSNGSINTLNDTLALGDDNSRCGTLIRTNALITGWFKRWIGTNESLSYVFPVGYNGNYRGVIITYDIPPDEGGYLTVHYTASNPGRLGLPFSDSGVMISDIGTEGYWNVAAESWMNSGTCSFHIVANGFANVPDYAGLHLLRRTVETSPWTVSGTHVAGTGSNTNIEVHRTTIGGNASGQYAIGGRKVSNSPIQFVRFDAEKDGETVDLTWVTVNEMNSDYFSVERSSNGITFMPLRTVGAAGNSITLLNYKTKDDKPLAGANHYRLKLTDFNGQTSYSEIRTVTFKKFNVDDLLQVESLSPNPFIDNFTLQYSTTIPCIVNLRIMSTAGAIVKQEKLTAEAGLNIYSFTDPDVLIAGVYYVSLQIGNRVIAKKVVKVS
jgi:hypothetical protein